MSGNKAISYVIAVSGGVDSMALLHMLARARKEEGESNKKNIVADSSFHIPPSTFQLLVAHFDHGIREDSAADRQFVEDSARQLRLPFTYDEGHLGAGTSEAAARKARYAFLQGVRKASGAKAIVTAHHEDDMFETAILNLLRGTGRKGLSSLQSTNDIYRPLLGTSKRQLMAYAQANGLKWREDPTNAEDNYLRNYVRHHILPKFNDDSRALLRQLIKTSQDQNMRIDQLLADQLHLQPAFDLLDRHWFIMLPHSVATEIMMAWLRSRGIRDFDKKLIERLTLAAKSYAAGKQIDVNRDYVVQVRAHDLALVARD